MPDAASPGLELGLSSGALYPHVATEETAEVAARLGLWELELMLQTAGEYEAIFLRDTARRCREAGCRVHAVHLWRDFHPLLSPYPRRVAEGYAHFARAIEGAQLLGARVLVWHGPEQGELGPEAAWEGFIDVAAERVAACGAAGLTLAVENVSWCALASAREVSAFAARLPDAPGFAFDPFQAAEAGANPFMVLAAMGERVVDVHLSDRRAADPTARHLPPGDGDLPWPALLRAIAGAGYTGPLIVEGRLGPDPASSLARVRQRLDPVLAALGRPLETAATGEPLCQGVAPAGLRTGIALFNAQRFYDAHEAIEPEWHAERRPIRRLYQGILQIGIGFHHAQNGNQRGAIALLTDGIAKTGAFIPRCLGIETGQLVAESQACLDQLLSRGAIDQSRIPTIVWTPPGETLPDPC